MNNRWDHHPISDDQAGKAVRARASAQVAARKELLDLFPEEYKEMYRKHCRRIFEERGLGEPEFRDHD